MHVRHLLVGSLMVSCPRALVVDLASHVSLVAAEGIVFVVTWRETRDCVHELDVLRVHAPRGRTLSSVFYQNSESARMIVTSSLCFTNTRSGTSLSGGIYFAYVCAYPTSVFPGR